MRLSVHEVKLPPHLLFTEHLDPEDDPNQAFHTGDVDVLREGNATHNSIGFLFLCDINQHEELTLMVGGDGGEGGEEEVTVTVEEMEPQEVSGFAEEFMTDCFKHNLRYATINS